MIFELKKSGKNLKVIAIDGERVYDVKQNLDSECGIIISDSFLTFGSADTKSIKGLVDSVLSRNGFK